MVKKNSDADQKTKVFKDPVHGTIEIPELCVKIIDTPQFQRLRYLKQLGACYYVYPGASHNRFEHSIGVCHLAGQLARNLKQNQNLKINDREILCVEIAGLCHDLGHGPFSHMFDAMFIPKAIEARKAKARKARKVRKATKSKQESKWKHEKGSLAMFDYLLDENQEINDELSQLEKTFIKEMIHRDKKKRRKGSKKTYLYEIVSNDLTGVDVDKWDYFARDSLYLGLNKGFDHIRFMKFVRVLEDDKKEKHICPRDKEASALYDMFHTRYMLHSRAYQHKVNKIIEHMICDALLLADEHLRFPIKDGDPVRLSETITHMDAYTQVTDNVYHQILHSQDDDLQEARKIIERIERRQLYKWLGQIEPEDSCQDKFEKEIKEIYKCCGPNKHGLEQKHLDYFEVKMDYGKKEQDPLKNAWFWKKEDPDTAIEVPKEKVSRVLPKNFQDRFIHFYCKHPEADSEAVEVAKNGFKEWIKKKENKGRKRKGSSTERPDKKRSKKANKGVQMRGKQRKQSPSQSQGRSRFRKANGGVQKKGR